MNSKDEAIKDKGLQKDLTGWMGSFRAKAFYRNITMRLQSDECHYGLCSDAQK